MRGWIWKRQTPVEKEEDVETLETAVTTDTKKEEDRPLTLDELDSFRSLSTLTAKSGKASASAESKVVSYNMWWPHHHGLFIVFLSRF